MEKIRHTKYEEARLLGARSLQIAMGAPPLVKLSEKELEKINYNPLAIAKIEFEKGVIPIMVKRSSHLIGEVKLVMKGKETKAKEDKAKEDK